MSVESVVVIYLILVVGITLQVYFLARNRVKNVGFITFLGFLCAAIFFPAGLLFAIVLSVKEPLAKN